MLFCLERARTAYFKIGEREHTELIITITAEPLIGEPDEVEIAARQSLVTSATAEDGSPIELSDLDGLDVSGGIRAAYSRALGNARRRLGPLIEGQA